MFRVFGNVKVMTTYYKSVCLRICKINNKLASETPLMYEIPLMHAQTVHYV